MIADDAELGNGAEIAGHIDHLFALARAAAEQGQPAHHVEEAIWKQVLRLGREAFALFLRLQGSGDLGPDVALPDGSVARRLPAPHERVYRSVFGDFTLARTCYGSRAGQAMAFVPLDARLQLPESDYSYLLQRWDAALGCESAFARVRATLLDVLGVDQPVDSLERITRQMAAPVAAFHDVRPLPTPADEGDLFVVSADGKGVPMRRGPGDPAAKAHRGKGDKANKKRMAVVGTIYSVDRYVRTPAEVVAALFRDPRPAGAVPVGRPAPVGKHVWARLSAAADGSLVEPVATVFGWLTAELGRRDAAGDAPVVCVMDGQELLWEGLRTSASGSPAVAVLDLLHVAPRVWQAAHVFHPEGSAAAVAFVRERLLRILQGGSRSVVSGLRRQGTLRGLSAAKATTLAKVCRYLAANARRMRYDVYLAQGYPIASGVIEGACRHYVKDRMERSGMRWTRAGAQAMLDVRSEYLNGDWAGFQQFRIHVEAERLYPDRAILDQVSWPLAA